MGKFKDRKPWSFCETPDEKCAMNYCDENGCQNRNRRYADLAPPQLISMINKDKEYSEKVVRIITEDATLKSLYQAKVRILSTSPPKPLLNIISGELEYVYENNMIVKLDELIDERINKLKFIYCMGSSQ